MLFPNLLTSLLGRSIQDLNIFAQFVFTLFLVHRVFLLSEHCFLQTSIFSPKFTLIDDCHVEKNVYNTRNSHTSLTLLKN